MEVFEQVKAWAEAALGGRVSLDLTCHTPGSAGFYPHGIQVLRRWEDVLGRRKRLVCYSFLLRFVTPKGQQAQALLYRLQQLAEQWPASLGRMEATGGKLLKTGSDGLGIYEIRLNAEREELV